MSDYLTRNIVKDTPQTEPVSSLQVPNSAGGFSFKVGPMDQLRRFLILGSQGGTYYVGESDLTKKNLDNIKNLIANDPNAVINMVTEISFEGRAFRNDAALLVLAMVMTFGTDKAKAYARTKVNDIVRTATHLFQYIKFLKALSPDAGFGTSRNRSIADWYNSKSTDELAYQVVKYRQREGWTHMDAIRQSHPKGIDEQLGNWILGKPVDYSETPKIIYGFKLLQEARTVKEVLDALDHNKQLPWEAIPTQYLKSDDVWKKLFYNGQLNGQALVRNITRLARLNAFDDLTFAHDYADKLTNEQMIVKTRLHPLNFLNALTVYTDGQIDRRNNSMSYYGYGHGAKNKDWTSSSIILDALNEGVHLSFKSIEPTNKRTLLAVDVSGSMSSAIGMGLDLTAAQVSGVMAAVIARTEPLHQIMGFADDFRDLGISSRDMLSNVMRKVQLSNFGRTDCSLPMTWALEGRTRKFDTFIVITDNETYAGRVHPHVALQNYRRKTGIDARLIVVGVASTEFTIADPNDSGMLDVVGCDSNLPKLIAEFSKGLI